MGLPSVPLLPQQAAHALAPTTDPISQSIVGVVLVAVFALLAYETAHRVLIAMASVAFLWGVTYATPFHLITFEGSLRALDLNVLVLLASMMALVGVLKTTGVFESAVSRIVRRAKGRPLTILALVLWFTAAASALLDNVTTVIFVTPMVLGIARRLRINAAALLLPMVMASNIGGTATLIGDPPNILIGSGAGLSFVEFLFVLAVPCIVMMWWLEWFSRHRFRADLCRAAEPATPDGQALPLTNPALARFMGIICVLVLAGFLTHHLTGMPPAVPALMGAAAALVVQDVLYVRARHPTHEERRHGVLQVTEDDIEWPTLAFFGFLFIVVGAAVDTGLIARVAHGLEAAIANTAGALGLGEMGRIAIAALLICWVSGVASALIDNIPFVAVSIPIVRQVVSTLPGDASALWWALALGACLGGNATVIGASANVTTIGIAERAGLRITFRDFSRFGTPVAIGTLVLSSCYLLLYVWIGQNGALLAFLGLGVVALAWRATWKDAAPPVRTTPTPP